MSTCTQIIAHLHEDNIFELCCFVLDNTLSSKTKTKKNCEDLLKTAISAQEIRES